MAGEHENGLQEDWGQPGRYVGTHEGEWTPAERQAYRAEMQAQAARYTSEAMTQVQAFRERWEHLAPRNDLAQEPQARDRGREGGYGR